MKAADQIREPHSVWLCLSETDNQFLSRIIASFCNLTGTANFQPHVTVLGDIDAPPVEALGLCREIFSGVPPISARVTDVASSSAYFMSLFLDLEVPDVLGSCRRRLAKDLQVEEPGAFRPHISLAYGLSDEQRGQEGIIGLTTGLIGRQFTLSQVACVSSAREIPIAQWRVMDVVNL